jgi:hypothetical protein
MTVKRARLADLNRTALAFPPRCRFPMEDVWLGNLERAKGFEPGAIGDAL